MARASGHSFPRHPIVMVIVAMSLIVGVASLPGVRPGPLDHDPTEEAESIYQGFLSRMASGIARPPDAAATPPVDRQPLTRDLFGPPGRPARLVSPGSVAATESDLAEAEAMSTSDPRLTGLLVDGERRFAVIDGRSVTEGDSVAGYWVTEITTTSVLLWKDGVFMRRWWSDTR